MATRKYQDDDGIVNVPEVNTGDTVTLVFTKNRSFELHIGNTMYRFESNGQAIVPRSVLTHADFTDEIRQYFIIKEQ